MTTRWEAVARILRHPDCNGAGPIQLLAHDDFYDESELPFMVEGGGSIVHVIPDTGFRKEGLAATADERLLIVDCPDDEGWLVPEDILADWLNRNVSCPDLEDIILAHPLYEYLTVLDEDGRSRGGMRGELVQWAPGVPNLASVYAPEFLPDDEDAPGVNRDRDAYADAVADLIRQLEAAFRPVEVELGVRFADREAAGDGREMEPRLLGQVAA